MAKAPKTINNRLNKKKLHSDKLKKNKKRYIDHADFFLYNREFEKALRGRMYAHII